MFLFSCAYAYAYVACVMLIAQVGTRLKEQPLVVDSSDSDVDKVYLIILRSSTVIFLRFDRLRIKYNSQILAGKQKQRCG